mmetsp:Transcript_25613/g.42786  ORF Transcript_25613/g.42786 Transcript_25613/m.42786 type:complete len:88 (+) Transcript_25613:40-303(+)
MNNMLTLPTKIQFFPPVLHNFSPSLPELSFNQAHGFRGQGTLKKSTREKIPGLHISIVALTTLCKWKINCYRQPVAKRLWTVLESGA